jgi:hypothetical protein
VLLLGQKLKATTLNIYFEFVAELSPFKTFDFYEPH